MKIYPQLLPCDEL